MAVTYHLSSYVFTINSLNFNPYVTITLSNSTNPIWKSNSPFVKIGNSTVIGPIVSNGNNLLNETKNDENNHSVQFIHNITTTATSTSSILSLFGEILYSNYLYDYTFNFIVPSMNQRYIHFDFRISNPRNDFNRIYLSYESERDERIYGFGESFSCLNLKGRIVQNLVSEQGVGRGLEPLTSYFNNNVSAGSGGSWYTTYAPIPAYLTSYNRGFILNGSEITLFDLTTQNTNNNDSLVDYITIEKWSNSMSGKILWGTSWLDLITTITESTGRPRKLPSWSQTGAVVGLEGGTENVTKLVSKLQQAGVPIAGVWLQDWVGIRHSWDGDRLIWNWEVNSDWYPDWNKMVNIWARQGMRTLTYISPFFSDPSNFTSSEALHHNFYQEGIDNGYFVMKSNGTNQLIVYTLQSLSIQFCMLDVTNPSAVRWMKDMIKQQMLNESKTSGWMADFGEYLPMDAILFNGESPMTVHNRYPQEWAKIIREAVSEAGRDDDILFFMRSAWTISSRYVSLYWLGDQLESWDGYDGLGSAINGALSSGLTGEAIIHSDIGGYNSVTGLNNSQLYYVRTSELLKRWSEFAAFGSGIFRTHVGSSMSNVNAQIYDNDDSMLNFAKFASIFGNLSSYREILMEDASFYGYPLMRMMMFHYAYDEYTWELTNDPVTQNSQYMFGSEFLVAPCITEGASNTITYLPRDSGTWIHLWSGTALLTNPDDGMCVNVSSPIGFPSIWYQQFSLYGNQLRSFIIEKNYSYGYEWSVTDGICGNLSSDPSTSSSLNPTYTNTASPSSAMIDEISIITSVTGTIIPVLILAILVYMWSGDSFFQNSSERRFLPVSGNEVTDFSNNNTSNNIVDRRSSGATSSRTIAALHGPYFAGFAMANPPISVTAPIPIPKEDKSSMVAMAFEPYTPPSSLEPYMAPIYSYTSVETVDPSEQKN